MRPVSASLLATVRGSHQIKVRARVCSTFQSTTDPDGTEVPILDGDVISDATAQIRSTLDLTTDGTAVPWPRAADDLLQPFGNEVYVERGVVLGGGATEWVGLGYFRIQTPEQDRPPDGPIRIAAQDRMAGIVEARLIDPVQFGATNLYGDVVEALVLGVYPDAMVEYDDDLATQPLQRAAVATDDRWAFLDSMFASVGKIWYWDHRGRLQVRAQPTGSTADLDVMAGRGGVLVTSARTITREGIYNAVVATGQGADSSAPVRAVAYDANPSSPTYYGGRFGQVPQFITSPFVVTVGQARLAAEAALRRSLGLPYQIDLTAVPNPAIEPWDTIRVRQSTRLGAELHQVRRVEIPLVADRAMTCQTAEQTAVRIGRA